LTDFNSAPFEQRAQFLRKGSLNMRDDGCGTSGIKVLMFLIVAVVVGVAATTPLWLPIVKKAVSGPSARPGPEPMRVILDNGAKSPQSIRPASSRNR
jgi:hypothetical protein